MRAEEPGALLARYAKSDALRLLGREERAEIAVAIKSLLGQRRRLIFGFYGSMALTGVMTVIVILVALR